MSKEIYVAEYLRALMDKFGEPMILYQFEKDVIKEALTEYIERRTDEKMLL